MRTMIRLAGNNHHRRLARWRTLPIDRHELISCAGSARSLRYLMRPESNYPSVRSTGLSSARPVRAFPAASANIATAVTAVHVIPRAECLG